ncbi:MAG TPA: LacI family DNA-binding transcriptional regulator [Vicinamibacterales bacterium]|nr:LacI family DNA-binding transcriptional regulator [Vicinamibacterales bacterium]
MTPTTMKRIAADLGVSITTVSKVLNNHADIGPATRAKVLARVEELGYRPNAVARSLSLRRTHTLGVVIPDLMHSFFVEVVAGIEAVASARGYGLLLCSSTENPRKERSELEMLRSRQVDGIVLASVHGSHNSELLQRIATHGGALVMIDRDDHPRVRCHRVLTDDELVGRMATDHLIAHGRRAIGHIAGPPITHARRREAGYRAALHDAGIEGPESWVVRGGFMEADGYQAMQTLLATEPAIDAVFAANDPAAIGALQAIWDAGLRVPDDIAVVGAGDIAHGDLLRVPLTTVGWAKEELGRRAAELIFEQLSARDDLAFRRVIIPPHMVVRESCGAGSGGSATVTRPAAATARRIIGVSERLKPHPKPRPTPASRLAAGSKRPR